PEVLEVSENSEISNGKSETAQERSALTPVVPSLWRGFLEADGYVSIEAEHFTRSRATSSARWEVLSDHGRTLSGMTIFPVTASTATPPNDAPCLEYQMWLATTGAVEVACILSPCLNFSPERGVRMAVSFDDNAPQTLTIVPKGYNAGDGNRDWEE